MSLNSYLFGVAKGNDVDQASAYRTTPGLRLFASLPRTEEFSIGTLWDGVALDHAASQIVLSGADDDAVSVDIQAPFFNDPASPKGPPGQPFQELWEYEVVELFFLNDAGEYLEVELCPHGQHLCLLLRGCRNCIKDQLPLTFTASISGTEWTGQCSIPVQYFPSRVTRFNAYAIHGSGEKRQYKSLYPAPPLKHKQPDFHRLEYFQAIDFTQLLPSNHSTDYKSSLWT